MNLTQIALALILGLTAIEIMALYMGYDGTVLSIVVGSFTAILGAIAKTIYDKKKSS